MKKMLQIHNHVRRSTLFLLNCCQSLTPQDQDQFKMVHFHCLSWIWDRVLEKVK